MGQIYLQANPLLREALRPEHIKPRLLGHWGTSPGLNLVYARVNRVICEHDVNAIFLAGPGHEGPAVLANVYLEGSYSEVYPEVAQSFALAVLARLRADAPDVRLRFVQKADKGGIQIREGAVDLETGVVDDTVSPELRAQALFRDRLVGVVRPSHALARGEVTPARYAESSHVTVSRPMLERGPIDAALDALGLKRESAIVVGGFASALTLARGSDLVATVPERHTESLRVGLHTFALPVTTPSFTVSMIWPPSLDADPVQRWLRACIREACAEGGRGAGPATASDRRKRAPR